MSSIPFFLYFCCMKSRIDSLLPSGTFRNLLFIGTFNMVLTLFSCSGFVPHSERQRIDSLQAEAYAMRYSNLEQTEQLARQALDESAHYSQGEAEAHNTLGFTAFMRMNFEEAMAHYQQVEQLTDNQLERLIADVGRMKICQRMALNKAYYDYRNSALVSLKRIQEEKEVFATPHQRQRLIYARSEFFLTSATYYYYLQQQADAREAMAQLTADEELPNDTAQALYAAYLQGAAALVEASGSHDRRLHCFDLLYATARRAHQGGYIYFEGNALQGLTNLMPANETFHFFASHRQHELSLLGYPVDSLLPLRLGQEALRLFQRYGDPYQIASGYMSISRYLNDHALYAAALDSLSIALQVVGDSVGAALVPECLSRIDEQLSVCYAGLDQKGMSDHYRNRYLDIMERTRQDKELESRLDALERETSQLNLLLMLLALSLFLSVTLYLLFRQRARRRNLRLLLRLRHLIALCRTITSAIPAQAESNEVVEEAIMKAISPLLPTLFGSKEMTIQQGKLHFSLPLRWEERAMLRVINPYVEWAIANGEATLSLDEQRLTLEEQRAMHERHIAENKRQNVAKRACLSVVHGIQPFIDRIRHEVSRLSQPLTSNDNRQQRLHYIEELATTINEYNDILAYWIKMRQGQLSLHIESFALNELFNLIAKGSRAFQMKRQQFTVRPTDLLVKADKALTLFMLNTLTENARKYTPEGGAILLEATEVSDGPCVEIAVTDNGPGLSADEVEAINEKALQLTKQGGFGLMNCKGIIEKYRKSSPLFGCCLFRVESSPGQGCRFIFRLPKGQPRTTSPLSGALLPTLLLLLGLAIPLQAEEHVAEGLLQREKPFTEERLTQGMVAEGIVAQEIITEENYAEALLDTASIYANEAYFSNVDGDYAQAVLYADSAISYLNRHLAYCQQEDPESLNGLQPMSLTGEEEAAEVAWWNAPFDSDFHVILDLRNEASVAFLALKQWGAYHYNNQAYTTLYKLLGEDNSLESYCRTLQQQADHKSAALVLTLLLLMLLIGGYLLFVLRKRLATQWNLEQVLDISHRLYTATHSTANESELHTLPQRMLTATFNAICTITPIHRMGMAYYNDATHQLACAFYPDFSAPDDATSATTLLNQCYDQVQPVAHGEELTLPLLLELQGERRCIGALYLHLENTLQRSSDRLLLQLVTDYWSVVLYNAVMKMAGKYRDLESASDESQRASWEESKLHVQNLVLDNCLSTIKHETIYYPNKIKQLAAQLNEGNPAAQTQAIAELIDYYKGIFTLLSSCADRQVERVSFRRTAIPVSNLVTHAERFLRRYSRNLALAPTLTIHYAEGVSEATVWGDSELLRYLMESLLITLLSAAETPSEIHLTVSRDNDRFIRITLGDPCHSYSTDELNSWFHPSMKQIKAHVRGRSEGTEYLICKQIIRLHDDYAGQRGCRINAIPLTPQGFALYFTLPCQTPHPSPICGGSANQE